LFLLALRQAAPVCGSTCFCFLDGPRFSYFARARSRRPLFVHRSFRPPRRSFGASARLEVRQSSQRNPSVAILDLLLTGPPAPVPSGSPSMLFRSCHHGSLFFPPFGWCFFSSPEWEDCTSLQSQPLCQMCQNHEQLHFSPFLFLWTSFQTVSSRLLLTVHS